MSGAMGVTVEGDLDEKPRVTVPGGDPPADLVAHDVVEGHGEEVRPGATVSAYYLGIGWASGAQFDASWDRGVPIRIPLDRVIAGWQEGIPGMRVGGRRLLLIPGSMAYGRTPPPGSGIGVDEALVFVVDLVG